MDQRRGRKVTVAAAVMSLVWLLTATPPVMAECVAPAVPSSVGAYVGFAFTATVADITEGPVERTPGSVPFGRTVRLDVRETHRGSVPDEFTLGTFESGCSWLVIGGLVVGETYLVSTDKLRPPELTGNLLLWRQVGDGWRFHDAGVGPVAIDGGSYPPAAAAQATTTRAILDLVGATALPDTGVEEPTGRGGRPGIMIVCLFAALALSIGLRGASRERTTSSNRRVYSSSAAPNRDASLQSSEGS